MASKTLQTPTLLEYQKYMLNMPVALVKQARPAIETIANKALARPIFVVQLAPWIAAVWQMQQTQPRAGAVQI